MFAFAIITIVYSYGIFFLGITQLLYKEYIFLLTAGYITTLVLLLRRKFPIQFPKEVLQTHGGKVVLILFGILIVVNFVGVLGPETSFDALWYHLTFPKLYLQEHAIRFIPGGLFYYSVMPKLGETLFVPSLTFGNEIAAKGTQFLFGILTAVVTYKVARMYVSSMLALLAAFLFYSNIVVAWESAVAYIDLIRAFFEILALYAFILWYEQRKIRWLVLSAILLGGGMATKILALGSLGIFCFLIVFTGWKLKHSLVTRMLNISIYISVSFLVVFPWLAFSYLSTGNPFYPFFTEIYQTDISGSLFSPQTFVTDFIKLFLFADDPISPIYIILLPLIFLVFNKLPFSVKIIGVYVFFALLLWYITPRTGGGRFILPYLPAFSVLCIAVVSYFKQQEFIYRTCVTIVLLIGVLTIGYRGIANVRYLPVLFGQQTREAYLVTHLNFSFGDFYDTDGYFKRNIKPSDKVLLYGFHNLYYVDFPFIHSSWVQKGDRFTYIATQGTDLPKRFKDWTLVYENPKTFVRLYKNGEKEWIY